MKYKASRFHYHIEGLASHFEEFVKKLRNNLALRGTAITDQEVGPQLVRMKVKYKDETGSLAASPAGDDINVIYEVEAGGIVRKGILGAIMGGGLAGIASSLISGDRERLLDVLSGAAAGGAYGLLDGFNTAMNEATDFSRLLAEVLRDVEAELREAEMRRREREVEEAEELRALEGEFEEVYADAVSLGEEIELLAEEGRDVSRARGRYERVMRLLEEAEEALRSGRRVSARAKIRSARRLIEMAREALRPL